MLINFKSLGFIKTKIIPFAIVSLFGIAFFAVSLRKSRGLDKNAACGQLRQNAKIK